MLFTRDEKRRAYQRIISGNRAMGSAMLSHTMKGHEVTVQNFIDAGEEMLANKARAIHRLVERGMIVTMDEYYDKSNKILGGR